MLKENILSILPKRNLWTGLQQQNQFGGQNYAVYRVIDITMLPPVGIRELNTSLVPKDFELSQNYPNPFNSVTKIQFSVPVAGFITLEVYDITGRIISTLINSELKPGTY